MERPLIAITIGDPAGIGPEIVVKALARAEVQAACRPLVVGDSRVLEVARSVCRLEAEVRPVRGPEDADFRPDVINVLDLANVEMAGFHFGQVSADCGRAAFEYIRAAMELVQAGRLQAMATAPIHKEAIKAAGLPYIGHTEMLADLTSSPETMTMFVTGALRIFFLSRHVSLRTACDLVTRETVLAALRRAHRALLRLGVPQPKIAVAGLNPHSGDGGLMGWEEQREITPAIEQARLEGLDCTGPVSADSVFVQAYRGRWDAVLSLYHDQGHIAAKALDFDRTVSVTAGLPFVRTSVDHGTAFDIAGRGVASDASMAEAIRIAAAYTLLLGGSGQV